MARRQREREYDHETLRDEREYGFYWYSGLWNVLRPLLVLLAALVLVFGLLSGVYGVVDDRFLSAVDPGDESEIPFVIDSGSSLTRVANRLEEQGLIKNRSVFKYYCDFAGLGQKIQAGDFVLRKDMDMFAIAAKLSTGDGRPTVTDITIIPGWTIEDIAQSLAEKGVFANEADFLQQCRTAEGLTDYYFIQDVIATSRSGERKYLLEGYLAPNTYEVYTSSSSTDILKKLMDQTDKVFNFEWQERAVEIGMTMDQVITLASLIEKEAKTGDFSRVSAVFHNRVKEKMKLGSDVTIHYVTGERRMALRGSELAIDSPYNTYLYAGLPIGPICNPSPEAIRAALYPDEAFLVEKFLYFCSKDPNTGELHFSKTLQEHEAAVTIYAPLWQAYDQERGM